jgi:hypothetical protein
MRAVCAVPNTCTAHRGFEAFHLRPCRSKKNSPVGGIRKATVAGELVSNVRLSYIRMCDVFIQMKTGSFYIIHFLCGSCGIFLEHISGAGKCYEQWK